jgi:hypothetical protein
MVARSQPSRHQQKRHGKHQKHTKDFVKVYWPYLPFVMVVLIGLVFSSAWQAHAHRGVLAYSTEMSVNSLLGSTNQQRAANGVGALAINSLLNQAAQAKANDMVARNYWSHNTPDGNPPWVFISATGYSYTKAGENLAYGFGTSADTVTGWMNSPPHKENLLDSAFSEVGFGFANSANFNNSGPETIVVAMYGKPSATTAAATPAASSPTTPTPQTKAAQQSAPAPAPATTANQATAQKAAPAEPAANKSSAIQPVTTDSTPTAQNEPAGKQVSRLGLVTGGYYPWLSSLAAIVTALGIAVFALRHAIGIRRWLVHSERYLLHHMVFDITIISLVGLCLIVSQSAGMIR